MTKDDVRAQSRDQMEQEELPKGFTNCQVVKCLPKGDLLSEKILREEILDTGGSGPCTKSPLHSLSVEAT